jgi:hypothetical protein
MRAFVILILSVLCLSATIAIAAPGEVSQKCDCPCECCADGCCGGECDCPDCTCGECPDCGGCDCDCCQNGACDCGCDGQQQQAEASCQH